MFRKIWGCCIVICSVGVGPMVKQIGLFNPMFGGFTSEADRPEVIKITTRIAQRYIEYIASGSTAWSETLSMESLPEWLLDAGAEGAQFEVTHLEQPSNDVAIQAAPPPTMPTLEISQEVQT